MGTLGSVYFAGFLAGCIVVPRLVGRIGYIRNFATLGAVMASAILLLLNVASMESGNRFNIAASLIVLAAIPICVTRTSQPPQIPAATFSPLLGVHPGCLRDANSGPEPGPYQ